MLYCLFLVEVQAKLVLYLREGRGVRDGERKADRGREGGKTRQRGWKQRKGERRKREGKEGEVNSR